MSTNEANHKPYTGRPEALLRPLVGENGKLEKPNENAARLHYIQQIRPRSLQKTALHCDLSDAKIKRISHNFWWEQSAEMHDEACASFFYAATEKELAEKGKEFAAATIRITEDLIKLCSIEVKKYLAEAQESSATRTKLPNLIGALETAVKLTRLTFGEATTILRVEQGLNLAHLTDEQLAQFEELSAIIDGKKPLPAALPPARKSIIEMAPQPEHQPQER